MELTGELPELSEAEWQAALAYAGGPVEVTAEGVQQAILLGTITRTDDDAQQLVLHPEVLPVWRRGAVDELQRLRDAHKAQSSNRGIQWVSMDPRLRQLLYHAVNFLGITDIEALADFLGYAPNTMDPRWIWKARIDGLLDVGFDSPRTLHEQCLRDGISVTSEQCRSRLRMWRERGNSHALPGGRLQ